MRWSLRWKLMAWIALPTLVIYVGVLGALMVHLRESSRHDVERETTRRAADGAARFDGAFRAAAAIALATGRFAENTPDLTLDAVYRQLRGNVEQDSVVYGSAMAFEPGVLGPSDDLVCPYACRDAEGIRTMNIGRDAYDWYADERWEWWSVPKRTGVPVWSEPYFDEGAGNTLMVTFSVPFVRDGAFAGVVTVDLDLDSIERRVGAEVFEGLEFFILTRDGRFVFSKLAWAQDGATVFESAGAVGRADIVDAARRIVSGETGVAILPAFEGRAPKGWEGWDQTRWAFFAPLASTGWAVVALIPEREVMAGANQRASLATGALTLTLGLIVGSILLVSGRIVRPIRRLRDAALRVAGGDLGTRVAHASAHDEIGDLARAFNTMTDDLRTHVERLASERAARERLEHDMSVARDIQQGLLPTDPPTLPGFEIAGWSRPADETGGDYYDWQVLPDGRVAVMLADVTGHGLGPALVTAFCRAYARAVLRQHHALPRVLGELNGLLGADLTDSRFITFVAAILDSGSSIVPVLSAGQGPILHYRRATGEVHLRAANAMPLGVIDDFEFDDGEPYNLEPGDVLALTTDGFFEWPRADGRLFGMQRLCESLARHADRDPAAIIQGLLADVEAFVAGVVQPDDLTAVVVKRIG